MRDAFLWHAAHTFHFMYSSCIQCKYDNLALLIQIAKLQKVFVAKLRIRLINLSSILSFFELFRYFSNFADFLHVLVFISWGSQHKLSVHSLHFKDKICPTSGRRKLEQSFHFVEGSHGSQFQQKPPEYAKLF